MKMDVIATARELGKAIPGSPTGYPEVPEASGTFPLPEWDRP